LPVLPRLPLPQAAAHVKKHKAKKVVAAKPATAATPATPATPAPAAK
jgi:hypothetical protein